MKYTELALVSLLHDRLCVTVYVESWWGLGAMLTCYHIGEAELSVKVGPLGLAVEMDARRKRHDDRER